MKTKRDLLTKIRKCFWIIFVLTAFSFMTCEKDSDSDPESSTPEIVGCNSVKYKGVTFTNLGCAPGIAGFDVDISQNGVSASFHLTCSNGCISSVTVK